MAPIVLRIRLRLLSWPSCCSNATEKAFAAGIAEHRFVVVKRKKSFEDGGF